MVAPNLLIFLWCMFIMVSLRKTHVDVCSFNLKNLCIKIFVISINISRLFVYDDLKVVIMVLW